MPGEGQDRTPPAISYQQPHFERGPKVKTADNFLYNGFNACGKILFSNVNGGPDSITKEKKQWLMRQWKTH